jgi:hypothetical protein
MLFPPAGREQRSLPDHDELAAWSHRDRGGRLIVDGEDVDLEFGSEHRTGAGVPTPEQATAQAVLPVTGPHQDEVPVGIHAGRRILLKRVRVGVDQELLPLAGAGAREALREDPPALGVLRLVHATTKSPSSSVATTEVFCLFVVKLLTWNSAPTRTTAPAPVAASAIASQRIRCAVARGVARISLPVSLRRRGSLSRWAVKVHQKKAHLWSLRGRGKAAVET